MGLFNKLFKRREPMYLYDDKELDEVDAYITKAFGDFDSVFHEIVSPDIHLDVCFIPPTEIGRASCRERV